MLYIKYGESFFLFHFTYELHKYPAGACVMMFLFDIKYKYIYHVLKLHYVLSHNAPITRKQILASNSDAAMF